MSDHGSSTKFLVWPILIYGAIILLFAIMPEYRPWVGLNFAIWVFLFLYWLMKSTSPH